MLRGLQLNIPGACVQLEFIRWALCVQLALLGFAGFLLQVLPGPLALRWYCQALVIFVVIAWQVWLLMRNQQLIADLAQLGLPNQVSLVRAVLILCCGGFFGLNDLPAPLNWLPAILYALAAILDAVDGWLARRLNQVTQLGARLDTCFDALGLCIAPLVACALNKLHSSYLLVSVAYYIFQWGLNWRRARGLLCHPLQASENRRLWAGMQMVLVACVLMPVVPAEFSRHLGAVFMLPLLAGFIRDWCAVAGIHFSRQIINIDGLGKKFYPLGLVCLRGVLALSVFYGFNLHGVGQLLIILMTLCIALGIAGRLAAAVILVTLAQFNVAQPLLTSVQLIVLYSAAGVFLLGTGKWSVCKQTWL
ncbi:MAG TPA: CDP-alcohol phosphatidyltransferase family protein [Cellvibrionaceae bacterium]|nr:CDP-alcohol phosphatidyltransferase family protein [Cellvibrionaceae bacterium]HMW47558.1 CDP-alcohol phosphatidyltransferase family protein [Cellvibrionaceae bacterium]HMW71897.1 CDP-alcohol phosphatidyltransferase family protein [Cellvibrionaceae bacterium]HMY40611.1 CDP-alcohol phosphatidyltransferase family protein [Marinagarivorans sp.]HNG60260.1 CDP-alcohol phosphatidyltransferase family protein [Cellvibrionaceae bacterium]